MPVKRKRNLNKLSHAREPKAIYSGTNKNITVHFFSSFEEEEEHTAKQRALLSYEERLANAENLRRKIYYKHLLPDGKWKPISKKFKIMPPYTNDTW